MLEYFDGLTWHQIGDVCILRLHGFTVASTVVQDISINSLEYYNHNANLVLKLIIKLKSAYEADEQIRNNIRQMFDVEHLELWITNWLFRCWLLCCAGKELQIMHDFTEKIIELYRKLEQAADRLGQLGTKVT